MTDKVWHDVYGKRKKNEVMRDTWGHLAPEPRRKYYGYILVAYAFNGNIMILDWQFESLEASPWQFQHFVTFVNQYIDRCFRDGIDLEPGNVYRYDGWYMPYKNGGCRFQAKEFIKQAITREVKNV